MRGGGGARAGAPGAALDPLLFSKKKKKQDGSGGAFGRRVTWAAQRSQTGGPTRPAWYPTHCQPAGMVSGARKRGCMCARVAPRLTIKVSPPLEGPRLARLHRRPLPGGGHGLRRPPHPRARPLRLLAGLLLDGVRPVGRHRPALPDGADVQVRKKKKETDGRE